MRERTLRTRPGGFGHGVERLLLRHPPEIPRRTRLPIFRHVELERTGKLARVLHRGRRRAAVMLLRHGIDGVTGAHGEDREQGLLVLLDQPAP